MNWCFLSSLCTVLIYLIIGLLRKYTTIGISVNIKRMTLRLWGGREKKLDGYLGYRHGWMYTYTSNKNCLFVEMIMEPTAAAEHTLTFWNDCFPISQSCDLSFHLLNWLALFSCSVPCDLSASASLLSHLCHHLSLLSSAYFSLSLSPWLAHSFLLPFPALSLLLVNFILQRFKKKKAEENITTKQNTYLKKDDLSKKGWGGKKANV